MEWIRKAPTALLVTVAIVVGAIVIAFIAGFVVLEVSGQETEDYRIFLNTIANIATVVFAGTGAVAGVSAARSSSNAENQTNGQLDRRDARIAELERQLQERDL